MGERLEKLKRMQVAATNDELPLLRVLKKHGIKATRSEGAGGFANRVHGDVTFKINNRVFAVECQVVGSEKKYDNFSYGQDKVELYRGVKYSDAYTLLGCYEKKGKDDGMIFILLPAKTLHDFLKNLKDADFGHGIYLNGEKKKYFTIRPENLASLEGAILGSSIEEVVDAWAARLPKQVKRINGTCPTRKHVGRCTCPYL